MKKGTYLFATMLVASMLVATPTHAVTSAGAVLSSAKAQSDVASITQQIEALKAELIKQLLAQIEALKAQIAQLQTSGGGTVINCIKAPCNEPQTGTLAVKYMTAKAADQNVIYAGERAFIYGAGLKGRLDIYVGDQAKPTTVKNTSDSYAEFFVDANATAGKRYIRIDKYTDETTSDRDVVESVRHLVQVINSTQTTNIITVTSPNNGQERYVAGRDKITTKWTKKGFVGGSGTVKIGLKNNCGTADHIIASNELNDGVYTWMPVRASLPSNNDANCRYKMWIQSTTDTSAYDESDKWFQILVDDYSIVISAPQSTDEYVLGEQIYTEFEFMAPTEYDSYILTFDLLKGSTVAASRTFAFSRGENYVSYNPFQNVTNMSSGKYTLRIVAPNGASDESEEFTFVAGSSNSDN